jgi:TolB-like protein
VRRLPLALIVGVILIALLLGAGVSVASGSERMATVAVFPVENLSGSAVRTDDVRQFLIRTLTSAGVRVLEDAKLDAFMARHRIRYSAGIDVETGRWLRGEDGVDGVLVPSLEFSNQTVPPKVALIVRLVTTNGAPVVVWADDAGLAGDDASGLLGLGFVNDYRRLQDRALDHIASSLRAYLKAGEHAAGPAGAAKFRPKVFYRDLAIESGRTYTIAVAPFFNLSERRTAGQTLALLFMRHLSSLPQFRVVDAGEVRRQLLDSRVIMDSGLSLSDTETLAAPVDADFVLSGRVIRYVDYEGPSGLARVEFSTVLIDRKSRKVVWSSESYNDGRDGLGLFERGMARTAHGMATQMVHLTVDMIAGRGR